MNWFKDAMARIGRLFHRHEWSPVWSAESMEHWVCYKCGEKLLRQIPPRPDKHHGKED